MYTRLSYIRIYVTVISLFFAPLDGYEDENGANNCSLTAFSKTEPVIEGCGKSINEVLESFMPGTDNSINYFDLYEVVQKYLATDETEISSSDVIETKLFELLIQGNVSRIRRSVETEIEVFDEDDIFDQIPSTLRERASGIFFKRYPRENVKETKKNVTEIIDILFVNRQNVQFAIKTKFENPKEVKYSAKRLAGDGLIDLILWWDKGLEKSAAEQWKKWKIVKPEETIFIGVACDNVTGRLCMCFYNPSSESEPSYVTTGPASENEE